MSFHYSLNRKNVGAMASALSLCIGLALSSVPALAAGGSDRGGGDLCEDRIKIVRDDLKNWIEQGGPQGLALPSGITVEAYSERMLAKIESTKIQCVGAGDIGYPVQIDDAPKICLFAQNETGSRITCDIAKFRDLSESDQYVLIHHEYAGLADIERPNGMDSHYEVSNQITEYLVDQVVKKLAVKSYGCKVQVFQEEAPSGSTELQSELVNALKQKGYEVFDMGQWSDLLSNKENALSFFSSPNTLYILENAGAGLLNPADCVDIQTVTVPWTTHTINCSYSMTFKSTGGEVIAEITGSITKKKSLFNNPTDEFYSSIRNQIAKIPVCKK